MNPAKGTLSEPQAHGVHGAGVEAVAEAEERQDAVTGDPDTDARAYNKVDDHTLNFWQKKGGKVVGSGKIVLSPDGKTRTVTVVSRNHRGRMVRTTAIYNKA